ncbi:hypothetical protein LOC67_25065 [Stieleria sp. JC731]|uniref:hypothetical protein n=1 Tax=Pirellulaceae TaxID=2691357 RepID=UPI001E41E4A0|nr:hypothetical protein [Stieleria sp. JC731]MCC9603835.1 hypothetical protein [Stieleria sp. JC731]
MSRSIRNALLLIIVLSVHSLAFSPDLAAQDAADGDAESGEAAQADSAADVVAKLFVDTLENGISSSQAGLQGNQPGETEELKVMHTPEVKLMLKLSKDLIASELETRFTAEELQQLEAFIKTTAGQKAIVYAGPIKDAVMARLVKESKQLRMHAKAEQNLATMLAGLKPAAKKKAMDAMNAEPFKEELLIDPWYANDVEEDGSKYIGWMERKADGTWKMAGCSISPTDKTYAKFDDEGIWSVKGRLIVETSSADPDYSNLLIVNSASPTEMTYWLVEESVEPSEWLLNTDRRTPVKIPEMPAGYRDELEDAPAQ